MERWREFAQFRWAIPIAKAMKEVIKDLTHPWTGVFWTEAPLFTVRLGMRIKLLEPFIFSVILDYGFTDFSDVTQPIY